MMRGLRQKMDAKIRISIVALLIVGSANLAFAQNPGTFNGRVVDSTGAVIPAATVTATNTATGVPRSTVTNSDGLYSLPALNPGTYDVKVDNAGFAPSLKSGVILLSASTLTVDFTLAVAGTVQTTEVNALSPRIETTQSEVSSGLQTNEVQQLPMLNRTVSGMLTMLPGVRDASSAGQGAAHNYVVIAGNTQSTLMLVDGTDNHDDSDGGTMMSYSLDSLQEFRLLSHNFSAEYGKGSSAVIIATTKGGGNKIHGSAFGFGRSDALTKIDYFSDPAHGGNGKPAYSRQQYGGSFGGPIIKDKAFYFVSGERVSQNYSTPVAAVNYTQMLALATALPNIDILPAHSIPQPFRDLLVDGKVNYQFKSKHSAFLRYSDEANWLNNSKIAATHSLLASSPASTERQHYHTESAVLGETWIINSSTVNAFTGQYIQFLSVDRQPDQTNQLGACAKYGETVCIQNRLSFPSIATGIYEAYNFYDDAKKVQVKDDISKQVGRNAFKFGVDYIFMPSYGGTNGNQDGGTPGGITFFDDPTTIINNTNGKYPQGFQTPGIVKQIIEVVENPGEFGSGSPKFFGAYFQDDLKLSNRLTLNMGVRYDIECFLNQCGKNGNPPLLPKSRIYSILKAINSPFATIPHASKRNISPRFGFAWDMTGNGKSVLRGGYGIFFYSPNIDGIYTQNWLENPILSFGENYVDTPIVPTPTSPPYYSGPLVNYVYGVSPLPPGPGANNTELPVGQNVQGYWYGQNLTDQYAQQSHIGYSRELPAGILLAADFTHILGVHEWDERNINPICTANFQGPCATPGYGVAPIGTRIMAPALQAVYNDPKKLAGVYLTASDGRSQYNELAVQVQRRSPRATFQASYVLATAYAYQGSSSGSNFSTTTLPEIPSATGGCVFCPGEWGPGPYDERHRVTVSGVFKAPWGIEISPSLTAASARPYPLYRAPNADGDGNVRCYANGCITGSGSEVSVNAGRGQPFFIMNSRVTKSFKLHKEQTLEGFAEFFNLTDRANFGAAYGTLATATTTFMKPTNYLAGNGATSGGTIANSTQVQFGARYSF